MINTGDKFIFGGDYNPEQWKAHPDILEEDIRLMKLAGCNAMSVGIFSWSELEPEEGNYNFKFLDSVINRLYSAGIKTILATPSGARPAWISQKYPEVLRTNEYFVKKHHGERHNHCFTSPKYRELTKKIDTELAMHYKTHPGILMWHISNEYNGACYCEHCRKAFIEYLQSKYNGDLDKLNYDWWNSFWSHTYTSWDQIEPPSPIGECSIHALNLEWKRFITHQTIDFYKAERDTLKKITPNIPTTTNWYWCQEELNYKTFSKEVDIVAWDEYPQWHSPKGDFNIANETAFIYNFNRCLKGGQPFLLMESTPSCVSYREANTLKRPAMTLTSGLQAIAHGADSVQYFQWRKSRGSFEKFHGAVVDHVGTEHTRTFREVSKLGELLDKISCIKGAETKAEAAIIYDRENLWALQNCLGFKTHNYGYEETCFEHHKRLYRAGVNVDVISPEDSFSRYKLVIIPMLYMMGGDTVEKIEKYVANGGNVVMTYISAYVNETDLCWLGGFPAGKLKQVFGIWNEEIDSMFDGVLKSVLNSDGKEYKAKDYCEIIHEQGAEVLCRYNEDFFNGKACVTVNRYKKGNAYYIAFRDTGEFLDDFYNSLLKELKIKRAYNGTLPENVAAASRIKDDVEYVFLQNFSASVKTVKIGSYIPVVETAAKIINDNAEIGPYETIILKRCLK